MAGKPINIGLDHNQTRYHHNNFRHVQYQWDKGLIHDFRVCYLTRVTQVKWKEDSPWTYLRSTMDLPEPHPPGTLQLRG